MSWIYAIIQMVRANSRLTAVWGFLRATRRWWLAPVIVTLLLLGIILYTAQSSNVAPFIYTIF